MSALTALDADRISESLPSFHALLRAKTRDVHERLHRHRGFASIQDGSITLAAYRCLVTRLYGFYCPFEAAVGVVPERSVWIADDLRVLGIDRDAVASIPRCTALPRMLGEAQRLGALYVIEGSTLGGRELFAHLDHLFGVGVTDGRRFLFGRGAATVCAWRDYLARLSSGAHDPATASAIADAAVDTFSSFEKWLAGWNEKTHEST